MIVAYVEVKYDGTDKWKYGGEFVREQSGKFIIAPRTYDTDYIGLEDFSGFLRVHGNARLIYETLSDEVHEDVVEAKIVNNTSYDSIYTFSFDALATANSMFNYRSPTSCKLEEFARIINDLYSLMIDRLCWKYENEYRVVVIEVDA